MGNVNKDFINKELQYTAATFLTWQPGMLTPLVLSSRRAMVVLRMTFSTVVSVSCAIDNS